MNQELERLISTLRRLETMALAVYTRFAAKFEDAEEIHAFWMSMARHEAGHVGALALVGELLEQSRSRLTLSGAQEAADAAESVIVALHAEAEGPVSRDRAFAIAVELESQEVEDVVLDLIHVLADDSARKHAEQMLLHDLSDLSLMIEKYCEDESLLEQVDAMVECRVEAGGHSPTVVRAQ